MNKFERKLIITSCYDQYLQLERLCTQLKREFKNKLFQHIHLIVVDSTPAERRKEIVIDKENNNIILLIKQVSHTSFWADSIYEGIVVATSLIEKISFSRIFIMNPDIAPLSFEFFNNHNSPLEASISLNNQGKVERSGFSIRSIISAAHQYPLINKSISEIYECKCDVVPTRLISFDPLLLIYFHRLSFIRKFLPHYGADFALTSYVSFRSGYQWVLRKDALIVEDKSTTGVKSLNKTSLFRKLSLLFYRKSTFNYRSVLFTSLLICLKHKNPLLRIMYIISCHIKLVIRLLNIKN